MHLGIESGLDLNNQVFDFAIVLEVQVGLLGQADLVIPLGLQVQRV